MGATKRLQAVAAAAVVVLRLALMAEAQANSKNNGGVVLNQLDSSQFTQSGVADVVHAFASDLQARAHFCFLDGDTDWNRAFSYQNWSFLAECMKTQGDLPSRLCTAAEIKVYVDSLSGSSYIGQNKNCNITSWISGCEPGWACSTGPDEDLRVQDDEIPARTLNCQTCCKGFFCPQGLTCMIREKGEESFRQELRELTKFSTLLYSFHGCYATYFIKVLLRNTVDGHVSCGTLIES